MTTTQTRYRLTDPRELSTDARRYLADELVSHLRADRWELREGDEVRGVPRHEGHGEPPGFSTLGKGNPAPRGSQHLLRFTAPGLYEPPVPRHVVALEAEAYTLWCRLNPERVPHLDRLLHGLRDKAQVFYPRLSGYGTAKRLKIHRSPHVTREEADAALSLFDACLVARLHEVC